MPDTIERIVKSTVELALGPRIKRIVALVAVVTFFITLAALLPILIIVKDDVQRASTARAVHNCQLLKDVASIEGTFIASDVKDRQGGLTTIEKRQEIQGFSKLYPSGQLRVFVTKQQNLDKQTFHIWNGLVDRTKSLGRVDCSTYVTNGRSTTPTHKRRRRS